LKLSALLLLLAPTLLCAQAWDGSILSPVNDELPEWLQLSGEYRIRAEGYTGGSYTPAKDEGYLLSRFQLNMDIRVSWFRFFAQMQDARVLGNNDIPDAVPYQDSFDLRQAFVQLGDVDHGHLAVRAGRQELNFGDQHILGSAPWLNTPRSFDAVRASVDYGNFRLDAFSASVVNPIDGTFDHHKAGDDLHGLWGTIRHAIPGSTIEPYFLWHLGSGLTTEEGSPARRSAKTIALRFSGKPASHLDYSLNLLRQFGSVGADRISAYAMNYDAGYKWSQTSIKPRLYGGYAFASGDKNPHDGVSNTFDQIYPSNHALYGLVDLFGWRNLRDFKVGLEAAPAKKVTIRGAFHDLHLANAHDGLYNGLGNLVVRKSDGSAGTHLGQELEGSGAYGFTRYFGAEIGYGHLFPGEFIQKATKGSPYNISYLMLTYSF
jgi:hypothetical protein